MKILIKNGFNFAVGMFWQIPDYGRKSVNLTRVLKDTGNDMYCQIGNLNATVGFCSKSSLQGNKNVASLGKFIVEAAKLTAAYTASIICYKFKHMGELDEDGNLLKDDLFGYLVLLNGTICPVEGEYVGEFDLVRNSIIEQAKLYQIDTLYLPIDVADRFLNIFERLEYAYHTDEPDELLRAIIQNASTMQLENLLFLLKDGDGDIFNELVKYIEQKIAKNDILVPELNLNLLKKLINSEIFRVKIRDNVQTDNNVRYLVASILQIHLSSDEIFWNSKLKYIHGKCILHSIINTQKRLYKILIGISILTILTYGGYDLFFVDRLIMERKSVPVKVQLKSELLPSNQLINLCFGNGRDRLFRDLGNWSLSGMKCNSFGFEYQFKAVSGATKADLITDIATTIGVNVIGGSGKYVQKFPVLPIAQQLPVDKNLVAEVLEQGANDYQYKLKILSDKATNTRTILTEFLISADISPVFLLKHGILENVRLKEIEMKANNSTGIYTWTIQGAF